jgi:hypothetical protein
LFKEQLIYEQSATRTVREQQEKRSCGSTRQPLKIEQLRRSALRMPICGLVTTWRSCGAIREFRAEADETLAAIAKTYGVAISMISRL